MRIFSKGWSEGFDGSGRRWVVYLKGCNYRCRWCANPEGLRNEPEILFHALRAERAEAACPFGAVKRSAAGVPSLDRAPCATCADRPCSTIWKHPAFEYAGEEMTPDDIIARAKAARPLFGPDGGVTFGGGEPTLQADELLWTIERLREERIRVALETNAATADIRRIAGKIDLLIADLKCVDPRLHQEWIGADNALALENIEALAREQENLLVRVPFIPGMNDSPEEKQRIALFLEKMALRRSSALRVEVLRLHHLGEPKYAALDMEYPMRGVAPPSRAEAEVFVADLQSRPGVEATLGG